MMWTVAVAKMMEASTSLEVEADTEADARILALEEARHLDDEEWGDMRDADHEPHVIEIEPAKEQS